MKRESSPWLPWVLLVVALLLLSLHEAGALTHIENVLSYVLSPLERGVATVLDTMGTLTQTARDVRELQQQVTQLQQQNDALIQENIRLRQYEAENQEYRAQLNFARKNPTYSLVGADIINYGCSIYPCGKVVGQDTNPYLRDLLIDVGSRDGIAIGMPVVTGGAAMVGRIAWVAPHLAYVRLINDPQSHIAAMLQQSRITGMVVGTDDGRLIMTEILPDEKISKGETVISSAVGGLLPRGLILGQIAEIAHQESALFQEATLRPALDFRRLETVLVITDFNPPDFQELQGNP